MIRGKDDGLTAPQRFFSLVYKMQKARHMIEDHENLIYLGNKMKLKSPEEEEVDEWIRKVEEKYEREGREKFWE